MWSKLFKKDVWCRRIYEHGTAAMTDSQRPSLGNGAHYPAPPLGHEVPERTLCWRCNPSPRRRPTESAKYHGKGSAPTLTVARRTLSLHASNTLHMLTK